MWAFDNLLLLLFRYIPMHHGPTVVVLNAGTVMKIGVIQGLTRIINIELKISVLQQCSHHPKSQGRQNIYHFKSFQRSMTESHRIFKLASSISILMYRMHLLQTTSKSIGIVQLSCKIS